MLSERLEHWEDMSPMEFVAVRTEVAKYERVARAADAMIDKLFLIANMRKDVDSPEAQEMFAALADLPKGALGG